MSEYVERKKLISKLENCLVNLDECDDLYYNSGKNDGLIEAMAVIKNTLAADVQEVRHGVWEHDEYDMLCCSQCKEELAFEEITPYCPYCGAKMDKGDDKK